tara:strand:- start:98 stop:259 length:162 start_codon:yes stop_codon:yes gene_type:complete
MITSQINLKLNRNQADLLLWCIEQCYIDLSDDEEKDIESIINDLDEFIKDGDS